MVISKQTAARHLGEDVDSVFSGLVDTLVERWGNDAFMAELESFRKRAGRKVRVTSGDEPA